MIKNTIEYKLDYSNVLIVPKKTHLGSRSVINLNTTYNTRTGIPIIASNMDTVGTFEVAEELAKHGILTCLHKFYTAEEILTQSKKKYFKNCIISSGIGQNDIHKLHTVLNQNITIRGVCFDVANGYMIQLHETIQSLRQLYPGLTIIAGNVVTPSGVQDLIHAGVDIVKVGIGSGSVCTTRIQTGIGYPQFSAVIECSEIAHSLGKAIIADGGCTTPGDIAKAFGGGADFVMLGGMLAGHKEGGGKVIEIKREKFIEFYGMSSRAAMEKRYGGVKSYRSAEGKKVLIPYKDSLDNTIENILGGIRSTCTYVGVENIKELPNHCTFICCTNQSNEIFGKN